MTNTATENIRVNFAKALCGDNARAAKNLAIHLGELAKDVDYMIEKLDAAHGWLDGSLHPEEGDPKTTADENSKAAAGIYSDYLAAKDLLSKINHMRKIADQMEIYSNEAIGRMNGVID